MLAHVYLKKGCIVPLQHSARERATHLHSRGRAQVLDRQRDRGNAGRQRRRGPGHPVERSSQGRSPRGHARRRHLLPAPTGLARRVGRLPAAHVNLGLGDKVALVCGASRGLGRAIADELAAEGASLALCSRDAERLAAEAAELDALAVPGDLAVPGEPTRVVAATLERFGRLDVLVADTGGPLGRDARDAHARGLGSRDGAAPQEYGRARRRRPPRHEGARLGPHPLRHLGGGETAGRQPDPLEQPPGSRHGLREDALPRGGAARNHCEHDPPRLHGHRARHRAEPGRRRARGRGSRGDPGAPRSVDPARAAGRAAGS